MNIAYVVSPNYDYLAASLIEGLRTLGHSVYTTERSNYGEFVPASKFRKKAAHCDMLIIGSGRYTDYSVLKKISHDKVIYVDGSDFPAIESRFSFPVNMVFKREYLKSDTALLSLPVFPLPFAAEKRYFNSTDTPKTIPVSFMSAMSNYMRRSVKHALVSNFGDRAFVGSTGERAYNGVAGEPMHTPKYSDVLNSSLASVNVPGMGWDCARYWEIIAHKSCLITQRMDIAIPDPFVEGQHYLGFSGTEELIEQVNKVIHSPKLATDMAEEAFLHLQQFHTSEKRAAFFLETVAREYIKGAVMQTDSPDAIRSRFYYARNFAMLKSWKRIQANPVGKLLRLKGRE